MLTAVVCGSFHRHMTAVNSAVSELTERGVRILSPADPRVVDARGDFLFVASDRVRSVKLVEDRHLQGIRMCDFVWLVTPDGYVGQSASFELGFAAAVGTPVFGEDNPFDITLRQYVTRVASLKHALERVRNERARRSSSEGLLISPQDSIPIVQERLEQLRGRLTQRHTEHSATDRELERLHDQVKGFVVAPPRTLDTYDQEYD